MQWLWHESSPVTVAGAAPASHRLPVHWLRGNWERTGRALYARFGRVADFRT